MIVVRLAILGAVYALAIAAGKRLADRLSNRENSRLERLFLTGFFAHYLLYGSWWALSFVHGFTFLGTTLPPAILALAILRFVKIPLGSRPKKAMGPARTWEWLPASYGLAAAALALGLSVAEVVAYPTWSWDCVWYHLTQSRLIVQEGTLHYWFGASDGSGPLMYANGYPRFVEAFSAFHLLILRSEFLVSAPQIPWTVLGGLVVAAWGRRLGVPRPTALLLGAGWILVPAVFLQAHTTHADVATGAQTLGLAYFVFAPAHVRDRDRRTLVIAILIAAGLVATKMSGLLLAALLLPIAVVRALVAAFVPAPQFTQTRATRPVPIAILLGISLLAGAIALTRPIANALSTKNPFYPAAVTLGPLRFPGPIDEERVASGKAFLRSEDSLARLVETWRHPKGDLFPDVKERPFGNTFNYFALQAAGLGLVVALRRRKRAALALVATAAIALLVPASWWGRFVLPVPAMALLLGGIPHAALSEGKWRGWVVVRVLGAGLLALFLVHDLGSYASGYRQLPRLPSCTRKPGTLTIACVEDAAHGEAALRKDLTWLFSPTLIAARDRELGPGALVLFDDAVSFQGELWNRSTTSRLGYASSRSIPAFLETIARQQPTWVVVGESSELEAALLIRGATLIERRPFDRTVVYRLR